MNITSTQITDQICNLPNDTLWQLVFPFIEENVLTDINQSKGISELVDEFVHDFYNKSRISKHAFFSTKMLKNKKNLKT